MANCCEVAALRVLRQSVWALRAAPEQALQRTKPVVVTLIKGSRSTGRAGLNAPGRRRDRRHIAASPPRGQ